MEFLTALIFGLTIFNSAFGRVNFKLETCDIDDVPNRADQVIQVPEKSVTEYPVKVPGDLHVSGRVDLSISVPANGSYSIHLSVSRYAGFFWLPVPCVAEVGSCTYPDACQLLEDHFGEGHGCPQQFIDNDLPCTCPFLAQTYSMTDTVFKIPELTGIWSWLAAGDYKVVAKLKDETTQKYVACLHLEATIVDGHPSCSGFLCSVFGR